MAILEKIEFEQFGPYRFIGKSVYARAGAEYSGQIFGGLWGISSGIFGIINSLAEYASGEIHNTALLTMDKYDEEKKLLGYTIGRFMKPDTPVPDGLDYFDISPVVAAKGWLRGEFNDLIGNAERLTSEAISQQAKYTPSWKFMAEVYTKDTVPKAGVSSVLGYYMACKEKA
jgi:hypothetical protein